MDQVFDLCVEFLTLLAAQWGTTYKAINVWIFCIVEPIIFVLMLITIILQALKLYRRKGVIKALNFRLRS